MTSAEVWGKAIPAEKTIRQKANAQVPIVRAIGDFFVRCCRLWIDVFGDLAFRRDSGGRSMIGRPVRFQAVGWGCHGAME